MSHKKDPYGAEHYGMWFVYAKGSGVFLQIGNTKIFNEHGDAYKYFGAKGNEDMCQKAAAAGYDTVQFIKHVDAVNYPCAAGIGASWMNMEIVAVKLVGTYSCGQAQGTAAALRAGWNGDKACKCDPNNPNTNSALTDAAEKLEMKANQTSVENLKCLPWGPPSWPCGEVEWDPRTGAAGCKAAGATQCCTKHAGITACGHRIACGCCMPGKTCDQY